MAILYREHRGSLDDSMATTKEYPDRDGVTAAVNLMYGPGTVTGRFYAVDKRIDWPETYIVTHNGNAVGFSDGW